MAKQTKQSGGRRKNQTGRPIGALNKDKSRPYFATIKNAILKRNPTWIEEIEFTLGLMNDPNLELKERKQARDTLLQYTHTRPVVVETQPAEQLGFNLQWSDGGNFDPASLQAANVASDSTQIN